MGYRSTVVLAVHKEVVPHFMAALSQSPSSSNLVFGQHDELIKNYDGEGNLMVKWDGIKWYEDYGEVAGIMKFVNDPLDYGPEVDAGDIEQYFRFVRIGEEPEDCEIHGWGFEIYVNRSIEY